MTKKVATILLLFLLLLNLGAGYFLFYSIKIKADALTSSAKSATNSVSSQNASIFGLDTSSLPKSDVPGDDPGNITRYRGAMRSAYAKSADGTETVQYKALAPLDVILSYYRTQLAQDNWILNSVSGTAILFTNATQQFSITGTNSSGGVATYTIVLN